tara:strand:+ start:2190 stop:2414 length:225 start_codon:yes stop_codon:yes gene_type:complete
LVGKSQYHEQTGKYFPRQNAMMLLVYLFLFGPFAVALLRISGFPLFVIALVWLMFLVLFAPINYFFGPFLILGP